MSEYSTQEFSLIDWQAKATQIRIPSKAWVNGQPIDAVNGETRPCLNPATGELLANVTECQNEDGDLAVGVARDVFER
ncbi:MAG: aldehyde dehydrogenase, partial [Oceanobacter sp.]